MKLRLFALLVACLIWGGSFVLAQSLDETRAKAEKGDAKAQYELAMSYFKGTGVAKDEAEAVKWMRKAADQGDA